MAEKSKAQQAEQQIDTLEADGNPNSVTFEYGGAWFTVEAFAERPWRDVFKDLADLSGENGVGQIPDAIERLVGKEGLAQTDNWSFGKFMPFSAELGSQLAKGVGTPGE